MMRQTLFQFILIWLTTITPSLYATDSPDDLLSQGDTLFQQGDFPQATKVWERYLATLEDNDAPPSQRIDLLTRLAAAYQNLGMHRNSVKMLDQALTLAEQSQDVARRAVVYSQFSDAWLTIGGSENAQKLAEAAVADARHTQDPHLLAMALNTQGNVLAILGSFPEALKAYQDARQFAQRAKDQELVVKISLNQVKVDLRHSPLPKVHEALVAALEQIHQLPESHQQATHLISVGLLAQQVLQEDQYLGEEKQAVQQELHEETEDLEVEEKQVTQEFLKEPGLSAMETQQTLQFAVTAFQNAQRIAKRLHDFSTISSAYGYWGQLYESQKRYEEALTLTRQAVFFAKQGYYPYILYRWYWQLARLFKAQGQPDQAIAQYQLAGQTLSPIQLMTDVGYRLPPGTFDEMVRPVYYEWADLVLQKASATSDPADKQRLLLEARNTIEAAKVAELQNYFQDDCVVALAAKKTLLDNVVPKTAVIYPIPLTERLEVLVSVGGHLQQIVLPVPATVVNDTAWKLRLGLQTRPNNRFLYESRQIYDWMIRPVEGQLAANQVDTLIIVPDGKLRLIPFSTLNDGKQFLVEKFAIVTTPGLSLTDPQPIRWEDSKMLLIGLSDAVQGYPPLGNVPKEIHTIQGIVGENRTHRLMNGEYSVDTLRDQLKMTPYSVIHLATHGEFDADPAHTYLLAYKDKMTMDKLQDIIGLSRFRDKPVELLTLSACKTGVGNDKAALGLAGVALKSGARSAIASLWFVDDEATSLVISEFYRQLLGTPGITKAKALQNAQRKLISQDRYWHPGYWAPFLLVGNWL